MGKVRGGHAKAARHHHDQRKFPVSLALIRRWQEQLAVDRKSGQFGGTADGVKVVEGICRGNFEILSLGAIGKNDVLIAKSQVSVLPGLFVWQPSRIQ